MGQQPILARRSQRAKGPDPEGGGSSTREPTEEFHPQGNHQHPRLQQILTQATVSPRLPSALFSDYHATANCDLHNRLPTSGINGGRRNDITTYGHVIPCLMTAGIRLAEVEVTSF